MQLPLYVNRIWLFDNPVDFRRGKDSLIALIVKDAKSPTEGLYLFLNKRGDKLKGICWHNNGFLLIWKELERGKFLLDLKKANRVLSLNQEELTWLLAGLPWQRMAQWGSSSFKKFS